MRGRLPHFAARKETTKTQAHVNYDVLIAACLLHDIGHKEQFENPALCHAAVGSEKAFVFLTEHGFDQEYAAQIRHCIQTHRYRKHNQPKSPEAQILFDADKLEHIYGRFYTEKAVSLAAQRQQAAVDFYKSLYLEASSSYREGRDMLAELIADSSSEKDRSNFS